MKFAQVGYGSAGQGAGKDGNGYTYIVSDNVKKGDTLQPAVKHWKNDNIYGTTGVVIDSTKHLQTEKGQAIEESLSAKGLKVGDLTEAYTKKESGAQRLRDETGRFHTDKATAQKYGGLSHLEAQQRGANILALQQKTGGKLSQTQNVNYAVDQFSQYSKGYMPKPLYNPPTPKQP